METPLGQLHAVTPTCKQTLDSLRICTPGASGSRHWQPRRRLSSRRAHLAPRSRRTSGRARVARGHPRRVGERNALQRSSLPTFRKGAHNPPHPLGKGAVFAPLGTSVFDAFPPHSSRGGPVFVPLCTSVFVALAGSELLQSSWGLARSAAAGTLERPLPLADVRTDRSDGAGPRPDLRAHPSRRGGRAGQARRSARRPRHLPGYPARTPKGGTFLEACGLLDHRGQGAADRLCMPVSGWLRAAARRCSASVMTARSGGTLAAPRRGPSPGCLRACALDGTGAGPGAGGMPPDPLGCFG